MKMHILSGGRLRLRKSIYMPDAERAELIDLPVNCYLLRHPEGNVLFDTGCHPSTTTDAAGRWGSIAKAIVPISKPEENLIDQLALVGLQPNDIDVVVNSHFHSDHCGCNEFFKKATVICHAKELEAASELGAEKMGYLAVDWRHSLPTETITEQRDLFNDGRIVLLPMPGHTPGMTTALVGLDRSGSFLLASDAVALRANLDLDINPRNTWSPEHSSQSMSEIRKIENAGVTVLFGHDDEQWKGLLKGVEFYD